jgi:ABC-2 type transport system ATP-binding protein
MDAAIEIEHLRKEYGDVVAVDELSFRVPGGAFFGFLGPNGAGKSTTIGCATGLLDPTRGTIRLLGEPMRADSVALKRRVGVMPETLALFDQLYADEFLTFQARMFGLDETTTRRRVDELLDAFDLSGDARKPIAAFSAGMRKRVAFAAAIIHTPEILFLDEPFESVDPAAAAMMKTWLRNIVEQGRTIFMTTHVLDTVETLCDRVAILASPGRLLWQGDIACLANRGELVVAGRTFQTLESLFLELTGRRDTPLAWV